MRGRCGSGVLGGGLKITSFAFALIEMLMPEYLYVNVRASLIKERMPEAIAEGKW